MNQQQKPIGLKALMIYAALGGALFTLSGMAMLKITGLAQPAAILGVLPVVLGILYFCATYGLKLLSEWGRKLLFWLSIITIFVFIFATDGSGFHVDSRVYVTSFRVISIVLAGVAAYFLTRPNIRELFT